MASVWRSALSRVAAIRMHLGAARELHPLAEHAEVIRTLGKRAVADIIEIGRRLIEAKAIAGHGGWTPWLEREFGWTDQSARNYMNVADLAKSKTVLDFDMPIRALYRLAAPSTPAEVIDAVADGSARGETFTHQQVETMITAAADKRAEAKVAVWKACSFRAFRLLPLSGCTYDSMARHAPPDVSRFWQIIIRLKAPYPVNVFTECAALGKVVVERRLVVAEANVALIRDGCGQNIAIVNAPTDPARSSEVMVRQNAPMALEYRPYSGDGKSFRIIHSAFASGQLVPNGQVTHPEEG
jgi:hypothetical protein